MQQVRQRQIVTPAQSIAVIHTLLRAGLGCITFLRNLLPEDNFSENYLTTTDDTSPSNSQASTSSSINNMRQKVPGFKIMSMARGYSEEADRILNYLEYGVFDALEKQYLRSFIFAIYLDSKDPTNIVEAYTFNFRYHKIPGSDSIVPIMTLGNNLQSKSVGKEDPVVEAAKRGKPPTLRDVKKSVKTLLKTLIHAMTQMDVLPKRRYATFKLFYTEDTPSDYEPPYFQPGDVERDRWYMMTHNLDEVPDKWSIGKIDTGYHSVNLNVTSIATYLPSSNDCDDAAFTGTTTANVAQQKLTPMQEAQVRAQQIEQQEADAERRNTVWAAESEAMNTDLDAEGEDDPDYVQLLDGSYHQVTGSRIIAPIGVRNEAGVIEELSNLENNVEAIYGGSPETIPLRLNDFDFQTQPARSDYDETQTCEFGAKAVLPDAGREALTPLINEITNEDLLAKMTLDDNFSLQQATADFPHRETIPERSIILKNKNIKQKDVSQNKPLGGHSDQSLTDTDNLACECGIPEEDDCCFCEGGCAKWFHIWCMGYHSVKDERIPAKFICLDCRLRADVSWQLIKSDLYPRLMLKYRDLAIFRRAIKVAQTIQLMTPAEFAKQLGSDFAPSRQLLKRLESEGFIQEQVAETDVLGFSKTRPKKKGSTKQTKQRRNLQKTQYRFNMLIVNTPEYQKYFDPSLEAENKLLGIAEMLAKFRSRPTQTIETKNSIPMNVGRHPKAQEYVPMAVDTLTDPPATLGSKRQGPDIESECSRKKMKISVAVGVDLAE